MYYDARLMQGGCEITLKAWVPLRGELPPLSALRLKRPPFANLDRIEEMLPQFAEELFCLRTETQAQCSAGSPARHRLGRAFPRFAQAWSWFSPFLAPAQKVFRLLPSRSRLS